MIVCNDATTLINSQSNSNPNFRLCVYTIDKENYVLKGCGFNNQAVMY